MRDILSFSATLAPGLYVWWLGRRLIDRIDDPALPELRFANGRRILVVAALALAVSLTVRPDLIAAKAGLTVLGVLVADFPARRRLFEETWSLPTYLLHVGRFWFAMLGLWLLLAFLPLIALQAPGPGAPILVAALGAAVLLWNRYNAIVFAAILRARPIQDPELLARFEGVLAWARCPAPRTLRAAAPGGHWVNAFALPSRQQAAVVFTDGLLDALGAKEVTAIFAHEIAHLEYYDRGRLLRREVFFLSAIVLLLTGLLVLGPRNPIFEYLTLAWPLGILAVLFLLARNSQKREHESDCRALELTGAVEPLVGALTRIHGVMRMPRRWRAGTERHYSHPSLADRVRAILDAAVERGLDVGAQNTPEVVVARGTEDPSQVVVLDVDRLHWLNGVAADRELDPGSLLQEVGDRRSIRYTDLVDLRLDVNGFRRRHLTAIDRRGAALRLELAESDVAAVKRSLERVDALIGTAVEDSERASREAATGGRGRIWGIAAALVALTPPFSLPLLAGALLAAIKPARSTMAAAGAMTVAAGLLAWRHSYGLLGGDVTLGLFVLSLVIGCALIVEAVRRRRFDGPEEMAARKLVLGGLAAFAALYGVVGLGRLASPLPMMELHLWARHQPGLALASLGIFAGLITIPDRRARLACLLPGLCAGLLALAGTRGFGERFGGDPLASLRPAGVAAELDLEPFRELRLDGRVEGLRVSPAGTRVAVRTTWAQDGPGSSRFRVEASGGGLVDFEAIDLAFRGEDLVAVLDRNDQGLLALRSVRLGREPVVLRETVLPSLQAPQLRVDPATGRWEVVSATVSDLQAVRLSGDFSVAGFEEERWILARPEPFELNQTIVTHGPRVLAVSSRLSFGDLGVLQAALAPFSGYSAVTRLALTDGSSAPVSLALTTSSVWCLPPAPGESAAICITSDADPVTRIWTVDARDGRIDPIAGLPGYFRGPVAASADRVVLGLGTDPVILVERVSGRAWRLGLAGSAAQTEEAGLTRTASAAVEDQFSGSFYPAVALGSGVLAVAETARARSRIAVYRLPEP